MPVTPDDPRLYIGASVEAKAMFVTSLAECSRRYGTNAKTKVVPGVVVAFGQDSAPRPGRSRATTFIVADFFFGDNEVKRGKLNIRSVKAVECSALHEELKVILQQRENPIAVASPAPAVAQEANVGVQEQQSPQAVPARRDDHSSSATTPSSVRTAMAVGTTATPTSAAAGVTQQITNSDESPAALTFHDTQWFEADPSLLEQEINGPVVRRLWSIRNSCVGPYWSKTATEVTRQCHDLTIFYVCPSAIPFVHCSVDITTA
ncbi:Transposase IS4 [Fragilaria crotonensis]|nr:Transposase IS4 [Fragilaria crotonensis]